MLCRHRVLGPATTPAVGHQHNHAAIDTIEATNLPTTIGPCNGPPAIIMGMPTKGARPNTIVRTISPKPWFCFGGPLNLDPDSATQTINPEPYVCPAM